MKKHLVIPDSHAIPGDSLDRYKILGKFILDHKPDVIVDIGDWWDMHSLCTYDQGKRDFVTRNVQDDIEVGHEAEKLAFGPIIEHNKKTKDKYKPKIYRILGNHEVRVGKLNEYFPQHITKHNQYPSCFNTRLPLDMTIVNFKDSIKIDGINYSHYFVSGVRGEPIGTARTLVQRKFQSCTMGHTHFLDHSSGKTPDGIMVRGLICGSYHEPDYASFAGPQVDKVWWNGLILKHNVKDGDYDLEEWSIKRLNSVYGDKKKSR